MELYVVIYNEVTLTWKCEWLIPIEWYDYIEMIYDIMNENGLNGMKWIWLYLLLILIRLCTVVDYMIVFEYEWNDEWIWKNGKIVWIYPEFVLLMFLFLNVLLYLS